MTLPTCPWCGHRHTTDELAAMLIVRGDDIDYPCARCQNPIRLIVEMDRPAEEDGE